MQEITVNSETGEVTARALSPTEITAMTPDPAIALVAWRASATCSPMQGILTLGKEQWDKVLAYRATASWAEQVVIDSAQNWSRTSENIAFFGYLLGYTDEQMDQMFRAAARLKV